MGQPSIKYLFAILFCIALLSFSAGRYSAPKGENHMAKIAQLEGEIKAVRTFAATQESLAVQAYQRGVQAQKAVPMATVRYVKDTASNHRMRRFLKDSITHALLHLNESDSSIFSNAANNGVLDMGSDLRMKTAQLHADSIAIEEYKSAYIHKDSANIECKKVVANTNLIVAQKDAQLKQAKKPSTILLGLAAIAGFVLVSL